MINKYLKIIFAAILTIILGAIGSGVWERFLSPAFDKTREIIINVMNYFVISYKDSIYADAAKGFHEYSADSLYCLVLICIVSLYLVMLLIIRDIRARKIKGESDKKTSNKTINFLFSNRGLYNSHNFSFYFSFNLCK